jgi:hypothetical protein
MMRSHRGSALLAALLIIGVLALVTVATLRLAGISKAQAVRDARVLSQTSCVDAARQYLLSRLTLLGPGQVTDITFNQAIQVDTGTRRLYTGHVRPKDAQGRPIGEPVINSVHSVLSSQVSVRQGQSRDLSNTIGSPAMTGQTYHVVVGCADPAAGDMELEFTFQYGL